MIHYVLTLWFLSILSAVLLSGLSIYYFKKSRNIAPLFLREDELQGRLKSLNEQIAVAQSANNTLSAQNQELSKEAKNLEQTIRDGQATKEFLDKYNGEVASKRNTIDSRFKENIEDGSEWADLDNVEIPLITSEKNIKEQDFLEGFKTKDNDIVFDDRIINAFHTSLKVQDLSPLVVLAGISGTGKSLLPSLYARELGLKFLQIAVQPRWDSPQDLFGFYNYMETRFKATELSRVIWSCDIYNNEKAKETFSGDINKLPMNIVLLDEMNLAKVEYYFSDMLSKLEVRRGKDCSKKEDREPAEIELECCSKDKNAKLRRMFVNKNTLFVGTINEDESTQSLSDKVKDRANVMRFGRPKRLDLNPTTEKFLKSCGEEKLTYGTWSKWIKRPDQHVSDSIKKIIDPINDELAKIGRPFAHRVYQGISLYVANYPNKTREELNNAIADQIEMKILPKLSGVEKDDTKVRRALENIESQIKKIEDGELSEAFREARESDTPFFQWRGVMR